MEDIYYPLELNTVRILKQKGVTQAHLAKTLDVSMTMVSYYSTGRNRLSFEHAIKIYEQYNVVTYPYDAGALKRIVRSLEPKKKKKKKKKKEKEND